MNGKQRDLPPPHAEDFQEKYAAAILSMSVIQTPHPKFSLAWLISHYQANNPDWAKLGDKTRKDKAGLMARMVKPWGDYDMRTLSGTALVSLMDGVKAPTTHNRMCGIWRGLYAHAIKRGMLFEDASKALEPREYTEEHTHIWTDAERTAFEERWPSGSKQRLVYALMFYTCQSCADVGYMGRQNVHGGILEGSRVKTGGRYTVRIAEPLRAELDQHKGQLLFLLTQDGKQYSERGLWNYLKKAIISAGLGDICTPHGLRGAGLTKRAESGATEKELMNLGALKTPQRSKFTYGKRIVESWRI